MKLRVAVIYGGRSGEHEVSVRSARAIMDAMDPAKYEKIEYFIDQEGKWRPEPILPEPGAHPEIDVVFPVLHGTFGEDGTVQGLLELADLPYVGAGVLASAVSMDKEMMKRVCKERMLPVVDYVIADARSGWMPALCARLPFPVFVKPANLGSSVGISKAHNAQRTGGRLGAGRAVRPQDHRGARHCGPRAGVLRAGQRRRRWLPCPARFCPRASSTTTKTSTCSTRRRPRSPPICPRSGPRSCAAWRWSATARWSAKGMARVDFLLEAATGKLYINEINTIPGFTSISMYPKMWEHSGIGFSALIDRLIDAGARPRPARKRPRASRDRM